MNSTIPSLPKGNFGRHLELPEKRQILQKEFNSALEAARLQPPETDASNFWLWLPPQEFSSSEYFYPQPEPFKVLIHKAAGRWWVYKQFERVDLLFRLENFQSKIQYLDSVPSEVLKKGNLVQINDYLSTTSVLVHDEERKRELRGRVGGGLRLKLRTMRAREVPGTYLAAFAREKIQETPLLAPVLFDKSDELFDFIQKRLQKLESLAANGFAAEFSQKLVEFSKENAEFVADRAKMRTPAEIQREINKLVPAKRSLAGEIVVLSSLSAMDCLNELVEYPSWAGYHYYFVRVCSESPLTMEYNNGMVIVKENGKRRLARLRFSRYTFKVQPSRIIKENSVVDGQTVKLEYLSPLKTAPSISSESGLSTVSNMSTATTSPLSWCQDWSVQAPHEDYEHRLAETSIPNEHQARILGEKEMLLRFNNEISVRLNALHTDMESLRDTLFLNTRLDPAVTFACENERRPTPLESPGSLKWLDRVEGKLKKLCSTTAVLTLEDRKNLEALAYAKTRYEPVLRCYEKELDRAAEFERIVKEKDKDANHPWPKCACDFNLAINESWIRAVECGKIQPSAMDTLRSVINDRDSCLIDSDCSNLMLVNRADRTLKWKTEFAVGKTYLTDQQTRVLLYGTFFFGFLVVLAMLLSFYLIKRTKPFVASCPAFTKNISNDHTSDFVTDKWRQVFNIGNQTDS